MKWYSIAGLCLLLPMMLHAQIGGPSGDFDFGNLSPAALSMTTYPADTAADAVVLNEFGKTEIDNNQDNILIHYYHVRIKILDDRGVDQATFEIPVYKSTNGNGQEDVTAVKGSTFNQVGGSVVETAFNSKGVFTETKGRFVSLVKFTLPNVKRGSIIEVSYNFSSPFVHNFKEWNFQSDIPKIHSEYWAKIPANLTYNISLTGYLKLKEDKRVLIKDCLTDFGGGKADCTLMKLAMDSIPAFRDEQFMTARKNYLSAVHFELANIRNFDGSVKNITNTWADLERQLEINKDFGIQLKRGKSFFADLTKGITREDTDDISRARHIYGLIQKAYKWDGYTGIFCENGIKKSFDKREGNIADINIALVAALRSAGLEADPVLVSTRTNGIPSSLYPVLTDFNYVLARLKTGSATYLLDASRPNLPFGLFPLECINGQGRVFYEDQPSAWIPLVAPAGLNQTSIAQLILDDKGKLKGVLTRTYEGYIALEKRKEIRGFSSREDYINELNTEWSNVRILNDSVTNLDDPDKPLIERLELTMPGLDETSGDRVVVHPFLARFISENPFKSTERHFPVDFGAQERVYSVLTLQYPPDFHIVSAPKEINLGLADKGGQYVLEVDDLTNTLILKTLVLQSKPIYGATEYPALREFYNRIIQSERADLVLAKQ